MKACLRHRHRRWARLQSNPRSGFSKRKEATEKMTQRRSRSREANTGQETILKPLSYYSYSTNRKLTD